MKKIRGVICRKCRGNIAGDWRNAGFGFCFDCGKPKLLLSLGKTPDADAYGIFKMKKSDRTPFKSPVLIAGTEKDAWEEFHKLTEYKDDGNYYKCFPIEN